ncbi:TMEM175 family protein [Streptococcus sp. H49]|uniref:TMEM175 family protein n=1 Tax=Streptococcus huangxiaojuni TaxID=3237239 RepID=UPI0034A1ABB9
MNKNRIEAFSDAVIAIIITIMVLELNLPDDITFSSLLHLWPMVFVYISSFLQILIVWVGHHDLFNSIEAISYKLFVYNGLWLLTQSFVPLGTKAVGDSSDLPAVVLYLGILSLWSFAWMLMYHQAVRENPDIKKSKKESLNPKTAWTYQGEILIFLIISLVFSDFIIYLPLLMIVASGYNMFRYQGKE